LVNREANAGFIFYQAPALTLAIFYQRDIRQNGCGSL